MPAIYILLVAGWFLLIAVFIWVYAPEPTIKDVIRGTESRP